MNSSARSAQQTTVPDLSGITMAHRAMIADVGRLAALLGTVAQGTHTCAHPKDVDRYIRLLCDSIHHHHTVEDEVLWPIVTASAGSFVDLSELVDDHAALDPRLDRIRALSTAFRTAPGQPTGAPLAAALADLHRLVCEHIADEERTVFAVIRDHVSVADWAMVEKAAQRAGKMSFDGPRVMNVATAEEFAAAAAKANPMLIAFIKLMMHRHNRFERRVFG
ncbi:hemerythrin domain-containing protein [Mycolicibacterium cosmeticum]|uniref:hemerythrin domain-containing protein n=1 Tax=Mycolicibacterium cosmeticum TaxID=258533 RepID=UPI003204E635